MRHQAAEFSSPADGDERRRCVEEELDRILNSVMFRTSKRSQEFLRYIVQTTLDGRLDELKERVIGNQVFNRLPDYDTGEHSIVRVKANELRKRLAQFYGEDNESSFVQIHLPRGSYTPEFRWTELPLAAAPLELVEVATEFVRPAPRSRINWRPITAGLILLLLVIVGAFRFQEFHATDIVNRFWEPIFDDSATPVICVADPQVLKLDQPYEALSFNGALPKNIPSSELVRDSGHYVGWGDALAMAQIRTFLVLHQKNPDVRNGLDTSFTDLSRAPGVLIGASSNPWTMQLVNNLRFTFERTGTQSYILDTKNPGRRWTFELGPPKVDYVVVSRIFESKTGKMIVLAAGLSHYGTQMAGEILTNPGYLSKALADAPADWPRRNMQLVLRVEVFGETAAPPTLIASSFW